MNGPVFLVMHPSEREALIRLAKARDKEEPGLLVLAAEQEPPRIDLEPEAVARVETELERKERRMAARRGWTGYHGWKPALGGRR